MISSVKLCIFVYESEGKTIVQIFVVVAHFKCESTRVFALVLVYLGYIYTSCSLFLYAPKRMIMIRNITAFLFVWRYSGWVLVLLLTSEWGLRGCIFESTYSIDMMSSLHRKMNIQDLMYLLHLQFIKGFPQSVKVSGKSFLCHFWALESLWKMDNSTKVFQSVSIFTPVVKLDKPEISWPRLRMASFGCMLLYCVMAIISHLSCEVNGILLRMGWIKIE